MLSVGMKLGPYTILASLGAGGMGEVYRARDSRLGREVAIKVLPEKYAQDADRLARFEREARAVATLEHPNILVLHDVGTEQGTTYAVMELLEGETLRSLISRSSLPWRRVLEVGTGIAEGLSAAHAKGIIHRDLKPENIFLTTDGRVKILDFGLARMEKIDSPLAETGSYEPRETDTGIVVGTMGYMAPEQLTGKPLDARTDLFAFGCVLYEMLAGRRAFPGDTAAEIQAAILRDDPRPLTASGKEVPAPLERLIRHCLEKKPENRFQSARDLVFSLRDLSTEPGVEGQLARGKSRALLGAGIVAALVILGFAGALLYQYRLFNRPTSAPGAAAQTEAVLDSIAVLPFENTSADPEIEYICDGMTENIINNLTQLPKLRVIARSTAFTYKGQKIDPQKAGRDRNVRAVLTGMVSRRNNQSVIQVDLVDTVEGVQLWGQQFSLRSSDLPRVQEEIVSQVADKLEIPLTGELRKRLTRHATDKGEAYRLYLKGLFTFNKSTHEDLMKALEDFDRAIEIDPTFALPYVGKANAFYALSNIYFAPKEVMPKVRAAALKALEYDPGLGDAHAMLGVVKALYDWNWPEAEAEFKQALDLNPGSATTHVYYGVCVASTGRFDESVRELKMTRELDPLSPFIVAYSILPLYFARQHDEAIQQLQSAIKLSPEEYHMFHAYLGLNYEQIGEYTKAIAELEKTIKKEDNLEGKAQLAHAYALGGRQKDARRLLQELMELSKNNRYVPAFDIAMIYLGLSDKDRAFEWLHKAAEDHSEFFTYLNVDPRLDSIRKDPRFQDLEKRLHLESQTN